MKTKTILILLALGLGACGKKPTAMRSNADCEMKLQAYMKDHGHEGTATRQEKEDAFREAYWNNHHHYSDGILYYDNKLIRHSPIQTPPT